MEENKNYSTVESLTKLCDDKYMEFINNGKIKDILSTMGRFVKETVENDILIMEQMPNAKELCTKGEWEKIKHREMIESPKYVNLVGVTLYKNEQGPIDDKGSMHVIGTTKLHPYVKTVYDISQTTGAELAPEIDKEQLAKYFDAVKGSLEHTSKGYIVKYEDNMQENSKLDKENKVIIVKNGMSINLVINELIDNTAKVLIDTRRPEGLTKDIGDLEYKCAVYAIHSRYGLDMPEISFEEVFKFSDEEKVKFKDNLAKVRSVVYQLTHNMENSIDFTIRNLNKEKANQQTNAPTNRQYQKQNQNEGGEL